MVPKFSPAVTLRGGRSKLGLTPLVLVKCEYFFCEILENCLLNSAIITNDITYFLQHANAQKHLSPYFSKGHHMTILGWPAVSPDLNSIENVWQIMKDLVNTFQSKQIGDWRTKIVEIWMSLEQSYIDKLMDSMPQCTAQGIE